MPKEVTLVPITVGSRVSRRLLRQTDIGGTLVETRSRPVGPRGLWSPERGEGRRGMVSDPLSSPVFEW